MPKASRSVFFSSTAIFLCSQAAKICSTASAFRTEAKYKWEIFCCLSIKDSKSDKFSVAVGSFSASDNKQYLNRVLPTSTKTTFLSVTT